MWQCTQFAPPPPPGLGGGGGGGGGGAPAEVGEGGGGGGAWQDLNFERGVAGKEWGDFFQEVAVFS